MRTGNLNGAVMALSALGTVLSLLFVVLGAPDDAHSEVVVGAIALPVLYLIAIGKTRTDVPDRGDLGEHEGARMTAAASASRGRPPEPDALHRPVRRRRPRGLRWPPAWSSRWSGVPRERAALPAVARQALGWREPRWHIAEPVNEVVYGTRGFDTFGETFLLLAAVVSVTTLTRRREHRSDGAGEQGEQEAGSREQAEIDPVSGADRGEPQARDRRGSRSRTTTGALGDVRRYPDDEPLGSPAPERADAMSVVTRTAARTAAPVLAVAGVYLAAEGYSPGGGFPAGAVILGVILLLWAGFGRERLGRAVAAGSARGARAGRRARDHRDRGPRPRPQGLGLGELAAARKVADDDPQRRRPPGVLRQRADRGLDRAHAGRLLAARDAPRLDARRGRRDTRAGGVGVIVVNYLAAACVFGLGPLHGAQPAQPDQDRDGPLADGVLDLPAADLDGLPPWIDRPGPVQSAERSDGELAGARRTSPTRCCRTSA